MSNLLGSVSPSETDTPPLFTKMIWAALAAAFFMQVAHSQEAQAERASGVWSLTSENDMFGGTDRNYSNGIRIERVSPANQVTPVLNWIANRIPVLDLDRTELRQGFALSHAIYTPEDITAVTPDPNDRPYAGWLYFSGTVVATTGNTQDVLQTNIGVVGPSAGGKFVQENWHSLINVAEPRGWESQLKDEFGIEVTAQRMVRSDGPTLPYGIETDYAVHGGLTLGNVRTYASTGLTARVGFDLASDFGPPRIRPALAGAGTFKPGRELGGYLFAGIEARAVGRDMFLDGNLWRDGPRVTDRRDLVGDAQMGVAVHYGDVQFAFTYVHRTEEFKAQAGPQRFGAVSISIAH